MCFFLPKGQPTQQWQQTETMLLHEMMKRVGADGDNGWYG